MDGGGQMDEANFTVTDVVTDGANATSYVGYDPFQVSLQSLHHAD